MKKVVLLVVMASAFFAFCGNICNAQAIKIESEVSQRFKFDGKIDAEKLAKAYELKSSQYKQELYRYYQHFLDKCDEGDSVFETENFCAIVPSGDMIDRINLLSDVWETLKLNSGPDICFLDIPKKLGLKKTVGFYKSEIKITNGIYSVNSDYELNAVFLFSDEIEDVKDAVALCYNLASYTPWMQGEYLFDGVMYPVSLSTNIKDYFFEDGLYKPYHQGTVNDAYKQKIGEFSPSKYRYRYILIFKDNDKIIRASHDPDYTETVRGQADGRLTDVFMALENKNNKR